MEESGGKREARNRRGEARGLQSGQEIKNLRP